MSRIPTTTPIQQTTDQVGPSLNDVDVDQFLKLLIAELQNQDPLNPLDNSQMVEQIGQIREISATDQLSDTLNAVLLGQNVSTASSLIGQEISALSDDLQNITGVVDRVSVTVNQADNSRTLRVHVGDDAVQLNNIREIVGGEQGA